MVWRLHTKNESFREAAATCMTYPSQADALSAAYNLFIHPSMQKKPVLTTGGGPPALPGWQQKFDVYGSRPSMKLPTTSHQARGKKFHEERAGSLDNMSCERNRYVMRSSRPSRGYRLSCRLGNCSVSWTQQEGSRQRP
jgi:hypothetical protein